MLILLLKVLGMWSITAVAAGLALGAAINRAERIRKDQFLTSVFATLEAIPGFRS